MWKGKNSQMKKKLLFYFDYIIPAYFLISMFGNVISYYLTGNKFEFLRKFTSWGVIVLLNIISVIVFCNLWKKHEKNRKKICLAAIPGTINFLIIVFVVFKTNFSTYMIKELICFVLYCLPALVIAIYIVLEKKIRMLISSFKWMGLIILPFFLQYVIQSFAISFIGGYSNQFAGVVYLTISYSSLTILSFCTFDIFIIAVQNEQEHQKRNIVINLLNIILCSLTAAVAGSKGVMVSLLCWYVLMVIALLIKKCKNKNVIISLVIIPILIAATIILSETINGGSNRLSAFIQELNNNDYSEAFSSEESEELLRKLLQDSESGLSFSESVLSMEDSAVKNHITNGGVARVYLYKLAFIQANNNWLTGLGPFGYQLKYRIYPHNIILECMSDFGYVITVFFVIFVLYLIKMMAVYSKDNVCYLGILINSLAQGVGMMFSGDLYVEPYLIWIITLVLLLKQLTEKNVTSEGVS